MNLKELRKGDLVWVPARAKWNQRIMAGELSRSVPMPEVGAVVWIHPAGLFVAVEFCCDRSPAHGGRGWYRECFWPGDLRPAEAQEKAKEPGGRKPMEKKRKAVRE